jgi:endonuclease III related protein
MKHAEQTTRAEVSSAAALLRSFHDRLFAFYGAQRWWPAEDPFEVVVGAYLTQSTSWRAVERSIANLKQRGVMNIEGLREIEESELRALIRPSGYMVRKAAAVKSFIAWLDQTYSGSMEILTLQPTSVVRLQLLELQGVGEETADAILLYALGHPVVVVDEYLRRVAARHGLASPRAKYAELQRLGESAFSDASPEAFPRLANEFHALIVAVGKQHCGPKPKCEGCPLESFL